MKYLLLLAPFAVIGLAFLPNVFIQRAKRRDSVEAVDEFRSTLPVDDTVVLQLDLEEEDLDAKWGTYWSNSRAEENALRADLNDWVGWAAALEEGFALECDRIIKQFAMDALVLQAESASRRGGWKNDLDRRSDVIVANSDHSVSKLNYQLKVEVAECTATQWSKEDALELAKLLSAEEVNS